MEREIKFRGRCVITGNWAYGYYYISKGHHIIRDENDNECIVLGKTIGQHIGLKDKNGKEIYEGDIIKQHNGFKSVIEWNEGYSCFEQKYTGAGGSAYIDNENNEVIGNIYENPELLTNH